MGRIGDVAGRGSSQGVKGAVHDGSPVRLQTEVWSHWQSLAAPVATIDVREMRVRLAGLSN